jgi:Zn-dependent peptidase ImmA (M78 family)
MTRGVITTLRDMVPLRSLTLVEALRIAELQANRFLELSGIGAPPVPETIISQLPRIQVERIFPSPVAGACDWSHGRWLIVIKGTDGVGRQRFSLAHEFKHILDNPFFKVVYPPAEGLTSKERSEPICDYFAACLLMPRRQVKRLWGDGLQNPRRLAQRFDVSLQAMQVRLLQIGLVETSPRCAVRAN